MKQTFTNFLMLLVIGWVGITNLNGQTQLYGMTQYGGADGQGTIFHYTPSTGTHTLDFSFPANPSQPCGSLTRKGDKFYGMTYLGGVNNLGVIFEYDPATNTFTQKFDFVNITGAHPMNSLTLVGDKFYGMTFDGGTSLYNGVIFEWDPLTNIYIDKFDFDYLTSGSNPLGSLTLYGGKLYGMAGNGGAYYNGVLFEWDPVTNTFTKIRDFDNPTGNRGNGALTVDGNKLYGMTNYGGGPKNYGGIFELDPVTNVYTQKQAFDGTTGYGHQNSLTLSNGKFYGVSQADEINYSGVIFEWDPLSNILVPDKYLDGLTGGYLPWGSLTLSNGKFYGLTMLGGTSDLGVIYEWDPVTNIYLDKFSFDGTNGANPYFTTLLEYTPPSSGNLGPVDLFVGVSNSDDNGRKIVLKVDLYKNDIFIGSNNTSTLGMQVGGNAEANCTWFTVPAIAAASGVTFTEGDVLRCDVSVKRVGGSGNFGVKLWDNNDFKTTNPKKGGCRINTVPGTGTPKTYYFRSDNTTCATAPYTTGLLNQSHGSTGKCITVVTTTDYKLLGSWSIHAPEMKPVGAPHSTDEIFKVYPNPATGSFTLQINNAINEGCILTLQDLAGKEILHTELQLLEGVNNYPVSIAGISEGLYIVRLQTGTGARQIKLIINR